MRNPGDDSVTLEPGDLSSLRDEVPARRYPALILVGSRIESARVGEVVVLQHDAVYGFGRASSRTGDDAAYAAFGVQRPGRPIQGAPLQFSDYVSRRQVEVRRQAGGRLLARNVGKAKLRVNGIEVAEALLEQDDTLQIGRDVLLLVQERPAALPALRFLADTHTGSAKLPAEMLGVSEAMWRLREELAFAARDGVDSHVLILGESQSGKELAAQAVHGWGPRAHRPFVTKDAGSLQESTARGELFGYERGHHTNAASRHIGYLERAHGSTLFLDEVAQLPLDVQQALLRVLSTKQLQRLGGTTDLPADFRLVVATNKPLESIDQALLNRLTIQIRVPSLNERRQDIPLLAHHLLDLRQASGAARVGMDLMDALVRNDYSETRAEPGHSSSASRSNMGYLIALLQTASRTSRSGSELSLTPEVAAMLRQPQRRLGAQRQDAGAILGDPIQFAVCLFEICSGNQTRMATHLGVDKSTISRRVKDYGLKSRR